MGVTTSLDAGWDDSGVWDYGLRGVHGHTDVFFPNEVEAERITGRADPAQAALELAKLCGVCVVKCGPKGAVVAAGERVFLSETYEAKVVDTTGAGDSFNAGFIYGFVNGLGLERAAKYGNACGSVSVTRYGGASSCASLEDAEKTIETGRVG